MKILFTKGSSPLSKAIIGVTGESVSHCALDFGAFIVHSNLLGVNIEWANFFKKQTIVIYTLQRNYLPGTQSMVDANDLDILDKTLTNDENAIYDFGALLFAGLAILAKHYLKIPLPKTNLWQSSGQFICTEWVQEITKDPIDSMLTPEGLYNKMKASGKWKDAPNG